MTITNGKPEGYTTLTPFLVCSPAAEAITFYEEVFGARVVGRMDGPGGTVAHAELDLGVTPQLSRGLGLGLGAARRASSARWLSRSSETPRVERSQACAHDDHEWPARGLHRADPVPGLLAGR